MTDKEDEFGPPCAGEEGGPIWDTGGRGTLATSQRRAKAKPSKPRPRPRKDPDHMRGFRDGLRFAESVLQAVENEARKHSFAARARGDTVAIRINRSVTDALMDVRAEIKKVTDQMDNGRE